MVLRKPVTPFLLLAMAAFPLISCVDVECRPDTRKCDGNVFYWCYHYEWRKTECQDTAPYCDSRKGCLPRQDNLGPTPEDGTGGEDASSTCTDGEQTCIGNNLYKCINSTWRIITCPADLPVCDEEHGCMQAP